MIVFVLPVCSAKDFNMYLLGWSLGGILLCCGVARSEDARRLAVLELGHSGGLPDDVLRLASDAVRGVALKHRIWHVMTRENMVAMLPPGASLTECAGDCDVETGRRLGVWLVVSGDVVPLGSGLMVSLKAHQTERGELIAQSMGKAQSEDALIDVATQVADRLLVQIGSMQPDGVGPNDKNLTSRGGSADAGGVGVVPIAFGLLGFVAAGVGASFLAYAQIESSESREQSLLEQSNEAYRRRWGRGLLVGGGAAVAVAGFWWLLSDDGAPSSVTIGVHSESASVHWSTAW